MGNEVRGLQWKAIDDVDGQQKQSKELVEDIGSQCNGQQQQPKELVEDGEREITAQQKQSKELVENNERQPVLKTPRMDFGQPWLSGKDDAAPTGKDTDTEVVAPGTDMTLTFGADCSKGSSDNLMNK